MAPWKLPLIVAAIAVPIVVAFLLGAVVVGGPGFGFAAGALAAVAIVVIAARQRPRGPIGTPPVSGARRRVLVVVTCAVEEPASVQAVVREAGLDGEGDEAEVLVLAPASIGFLDRWASDVEGARRAAQERLVVTVAALAKAGVDARARVGDEDVVQAVEDELGDYPADEVVLVTGAEGEGGAGEAAAAELGPRLRAEFRHVVLGGS
jgi:hypothetical protein